MSRKVIIGYYGSWATYRNDDGKFSVDDIDPYLCTHLVYSFAGIDGTTGAIKSLDPNLDIEGENFKKFNALKKRNRGLKTLLAVGGWTEGSAKYSVMAANSNYRAEFVRSAVNFLLRYEFDGLDMDWEYPNQRDSVKGRQDVNNFTQLLKELREEFDEHGLLLTAAVAPVRASASLSYDIPSIVQYLDFVNLMAYDMHGSWDGRTGHNAALHRGEGDHGVDRADLKTVDVAVEYWLGQGCPRHKLVLGLPFYGHTFQLNTASNYNVGAPAKGPGQSGPYTSCSGTMGYNEISETFCFSENWTTIYDGSAEVPYAVKGLNWISYDNVKSLTKKVEFALQRNLAGVMIWSIDTDKVNGLCNSDKYPLLKAINRALGK